MALAGVDQANALWLPTVQAGTSYSHHDGAIQEIQGQQITTSRSGFNAGLGAGVYGTTTPAVPGLYANFGLADALFEPLAARRFAKARDLRRHDRYQRRIVSSHVGLHRALVRRARRWRFRKPRGRMPNIWPTSPGPTPKPGRDWPPMPTCAQTELTIRRNEVRRSRESQRVSSARLAQLLRLDPSVLLRPADPVAVPIEMVFAEAPVKELIVQALAVRPELAENRELADEAIVRLRREQTAMLLPSIVMGASYLGMRAGHE